MDGDREVWRLVETWGASPVLAMGLDAVFLEAATERPVLRLYTWAPDTLSLGYFQRLADVPAARAALGEAVEPPPVVVPGAVVRRMTGGGAIHHVEELTFSIAAPLDHPLYRGPVEASYRRVHAVVAAALAGLGASAAARDAGPGQPGGLTSDRPGTGMCFHASSPVDLVWGARKGVGSAQRRRGGRVLHHGSIKLAPSPLEEGVATLADAGPRLDARAFGAHLAAAFAAGLAVTLEPGDPTPAELARAAELGAETAAEAFLRRR